jgi:hypothetical protein
MEMESEGWQRLAKLEIEGRDITISINKHGRIKAYYLDNDGMEELQEVFLNLGDLAKKHPDWLPQLTLQTDIEPLLQQYEKTVGEIKQRHPAIFSEHTST